MKTFIEKMQKALLVGCLLCFGSSVSAVQPYSQTAYEAYPSENFYVYNDDQNHGCCPCPCQQSTCINANYVPLLATGILGGVIGGLVGAGVKSKRHHSSSGGHCENDRVRRDRGETLVIRTLFQIQELTGGTLSFRLFAISPEGVEYISEVFTHSTPVIQNQPPFPRVDLSLTISEPIFGNWLIGVKSDFEALADSDESISSPPVFFITRSSDGRVVEERIPDNIYLSLETDHEQDTIEYAYLRNNN